MGSWREARETGKGETWGNKSTGTRMEYLHLKCHLLCRGGVGTWRLKKNGWNGNLQGARKARKDGTGGNKSTGARRECLYLKSHLLRRGGVSGGWKRRRNGKLDSGRQEQVKEGTGARRVRKGKVFTWRINWYVEEEYLEGEKDKGTGSWRERREGQEREILEQEEIGCTWNREVTGG